MGLDANSTRFLLHAHKQGVDFSRTAMIGRQGMYLNADELQQNLRDFKFDIAAKHLIEGDYAEPFFRMLGATEIVSFDASDYEQASYIHDFNLPLDSKFFNHFTTVFDGGTLEHIFNFPQAISNCMEMVSLGGHFLGTTPTNNYSGHGLYQFSPELFFRVFSADNGFAVQSIVSFETGMNWRAVASPDVVGHRVFVNSQRETLLLIIARKIATVPLFTKPVQQSDYTTLWTRGKQ